MKIEDVTGLDLTLETLEELIPDIELLDEAEPIIFEEDERVYRIYAEGWWVSIPSLGLRLHEGAMQNYNEDEEDYVTDCSVTVIVTEEQGFDGTVYWENDGLLVALHNYLVQQGICLNEAAQPARLCVPDELSD